MLPDPALPTDDATPAPSEPIIDRQEDAVADDTVKVISGRATGDRLEKCTLLTQGLDKPAGLTTFLQVDDDYDDGLSIMRAIQTHRPTLFYASHF